MPLLFTNFCELLSSLEQNSSHTRQALPGWLDRHNKETIVQWVRSNGISISRHPDGVDLVAFLSAIFPSRRTDRVYSLQPKSLSQRLKRYLRLGIGRWQQLDQWQNPGRGDLGDCVERTLKQAEHPLANGENAVTVEEVDSALARIASHNRWSAPDVRAASKENENPDVNGVIQGIYHRLQSREAKWLTRMILKDYGTLNFKSFVLLNAIDTRLARLLKVYDNFEEAVAALKQQVSNRRASRTDPSVSEPVTTPAVLLPQVGVKVGRQTYLKGRSVKETVRLAQGRVMSVERKHDGEYCQVHIDLTKGKDYIKIFSKSSEDSTKDRKRLHQTIKDCLRIGGAGCGFSTKCILEGEMVVYCDKEKRELDFCKIRKHVSRSGMFLGTDLDSQ